MSAPSRGKIKTPDGRIVEITDQEFQYGRWWSKKIDQFNREIYSFRNPMPLEKGGELPEYHFKRIVSALWPEDGPKPFVWHSWAERMLEASCRNKYLAVEGCASSGKTDYFAIWAIVNFIVAPYDTMVLVTSTTLKDSRKRIWGSIRDYWQAAPALPGKLVDSMGLIRFEDGTGGTSDKSGITLIAAEKKKEKEAVGKLIGFKNKRVIVIADEMPELSESILEASASNLSLNPEFQFIGIGNPASRFDAFGILAKPMNGWQSISPMEDEWQTERGLCIRFDGEKSPNVLTGKLIYPWIVTQAKLDEAKARFGENSLAYYRMFRTPTHPHAAIMSDRWFGCRVPSPSPCRSRSQNHPGKTTRSCVESRFCRRAAIPGQAPDSGALS